MIYFKIILFLLAFNDSVNCLRSSDLCAKNNLNTNCSGKFNYQCNDKLCASGKEICLAFSSIKSLVTIKNL
jgi:hypothetical protein